MELVEPRNPPLVHRRLCGKPRHEKDHDRTAQTWKWEVGSENISISVIPTYRNIGNTGPGLLGSGHQTSSRRGVNR